MDHGGKADVGFVGAHGDAFELLELCEEVLDQMAPLVHLRVNLAWRGPARVLGDHDFCAACVEIGDDGIGIERLVGEQSAELDAIEQRRNPNRVEALPWQEHEANEVPQRIGESQDFGRHTAFGATDRLA